MTAVAPTTVKIRPPRTVVDLGLGRVWRYRDLLYFFAWRDVKVRYKQTVFGAAWAILQPVLLMLVFSIFLARAFATGGVPYPLFAFSALVPWTLFAGAVSGASNSLVDGSNLVTKAHFPRLALPLAAVGSQIIDFAIATVLLLAMMPFYGMSFSRIVWLVPLGLFCLLTAVAVGVWLAALNVNYRDVRYVLPFLLQLWLFATPVAYPPTLVPERWRTLLGLNPMAGVVEGFRWAIVRGPRPSSVIVVSAVVTGVLLIAGLVYFSHAEQTFADRI